MTDPRGDTGPCHFVSVSLGLVSHLHRGFAIARSAQARGHRFTFVTDHEPAAVLIEEHGFDGVMLEAQRAAWDTTRPDPYWPRAHRFLGKLPGVGKGPRRAAKDWAARRREVMLDGSELLDTMRGLDPDLVITEFEMHRDIRLLLGAGWSVATIDGLYGTLPGADAPHAGSAYIPSGTAVSRMRSRLTWEQLYSIARVRRGAERWWLAGNDEHSVLDELADRAGIDPATISRESYMYYHYLDCPRIRPVIEELFYPGDERGGTITGPVIDLERATAGVDATFAERWCQLQDARARDDRAVVFLALGSILENQTRLIEQVIDAFASRDDIDLVISVGRDYERWASRQVPANGHGFSWVPQLEVLEGVDAMISPCGSASVHEAIWFGVPQLFISGGGIGQDGLIGRMVGAGYGLRIAPRRVTSERIAAGVQQLLDDEQFATRLAELSFSLHARDGIGRTVDAMESIAAHRPTSAGADAVGS